MSSNYDIEIGLDETLELDTIIKEWSSPSNTVDLNGSDFNMSGFQTNTAVLDPQSPGLYDIKINDQNLKINVIDRSNSLIDNFDDQNLSEYPYNQGGDWSVVSGGLIDSSNYHLQRTGTSSGQSGPQIFSTPEDGLDTYPKSGDQIEYYFQDFTGSQAEFRFGVQSNNKENPGAYEIEHGNKNNNLTLALRLSDGSYTTLKSISNTYSQTTVYRVEIDWKDPIEVRVYDTSTGNIEVSLSRSEPSNGYTKGGIGFSDNGPVTSNSCAFDMVSIK